LKEKKKKKNQQQQMETCLPDVCSPIRTAKRGRRPTGAVVQTKLCPAPTRKISLIGARAQLMSAGHLGKAISPVSAVDLLAPQLPK
jgi:hypothetical protein